jgi:hypothetical protein
MLRLHPERARLKAPLLVVPAYFRPDSQPGAWEAMAEHAPRVRALILNLANGPGREPDPTVYPALDRLRAAWITVIGYVDTNYGQRPRSHVMADVERFRYWYDVGGVCLDRVTVGGAYLDHYAMLARDAREQGASFVFFNHGAHPEQGYADHADLLGTFEGPWRTYRQLSVPRWTKSRDARQFYHVVYSVPREEIAGTFRLAARRRAGCAYITDRSGPNPYNGLPAGVLEHELV